MKKFLDANPTSLAEDHDGAPVYLARNAWHLERGAKDWPDIRFLKIKDHVD
jgi:peptide chain release factor 3